MLEADPYWQPPGKWALESPLTTHGSHASRLSQAGNPARPTAAVAGPQLALEADGASRAGPATAPSTPPSANYLYHSSDEGRSWRGTRLDNLPGAQGRAVSTGAFGSDRQSIFLAHAHRGLPPIDPQAENPSYPVVISRSSDGGRTWQASDPLIHPFKKTGGDGNHIVSLGGGELLANMDGYGGPLDPEVQEQGGMVIFRSTDAGKTWKLDSILHGIAETGFLHLGGRRILAALRNESEEHDKKTVRLVNSEDGGRTWHSPRPLTRIYGQAHGDLAALPGGGVVATFENRYPYADGGAILARVSWDGGQTWEPELYKLTRGHGYSGSVVLKDSTVVTLAGDGQLSQRGPPHRPPLHPPGPTLETLAEGGTGWGVGGAMS